jgi:hypothetical protein
VEIGFAVPDSLHAVLCRRPSVSGDDIDARALTAHGVAAQIEIENTIEAKL